MNDPTPAHRDWHELTADEQLTLREAYGRHLDSRPRTCELDTKFERFRRWLAERWISYAHPG